MLHCATVALHYYQCARALIEFNITVDMRCSLTVCNMTNSSFCKILDNAFLNAWKLSVCYASLSSCNPVAVLLFCTLCLKHGLACVAVSIDLVLLLNTKLNTESTYF